MNRRYAMTRRGLRDARPPPPWTPHADPDLFFLYDPALDVAVSAGSVTAIGDQSRNRFNLSQGTSARQPTYVGASSPLYGQPALRCDGDDFLGHSGSASLWSPMHNGSPMTMVFVFTVSGGSGTTRSFVNTISGSNPAFRASINTGDNFLIQLLTSGGSVVVSHPVTGVTLSVGRRYWCAWRWEGNGSSRYVISVNGTDHVDAIATTTTTTDPPNIAGVFLGLSGSAGHQGDMGIMFATTRFEPNLGRIRYYVEGRFGAFP